MIGCSRWRFQYALQVAKKSIPCTYEAAYILNQYQSYSRWRPTEDERVLFADKDRLRRLGLNTWPYRYDS